MRGTPATRSEKWARRTAAAGADWQAGVQAVTDAPGAKAAAASDAWQQKLSMPETKEKFRRNVSAVPLEEWKGKTAQASGRFTGGAQAAQDKMLKHQQAVESHMESGLRQLATMPSVTLEDKIARSAFWQRHMATYKRPS
jgi:hypothetical protein